MFEGRMGDHNYLMEVIDWDANVNPNFVEDHFMEPKPLHSSEEAALDGVRITNLSKTDPIVMLKHFGPMNPDLKR